MKKLCIATALVAVCAMGVASPAEDAVSRGMKFLLARQQADGHFSDSNTPALTALPLWAMSLSGKGTAKVENGKCPAERAVAFILACQGADGGFYTRQPKPLRRSGRQQEAKAAKPANGSGGPAGLSTYNTAVCLTALFESGLAPTEAMLKARTFLAKSQLGGDDTMAGGFGYGQAVGSRRYADLSNTAYAMDAMRRTEKLEEFRASGSKKADLDWEKALAFVDNLQQKEGDRKGGAAYNERTPQAGTVTNGSGRVKLMAYGSMSYAAVMSMLHAKLSKDDPRVRSALQYCERFWTVDENPGMGLQGLFYYYDILSRALSVAAIDKIGQHEWRRELSAKLVSLQKPDGSWCNDNNRFWEGDPVLCTAFAVICLQLSASK